MLIVVIILSVVVIITLGIIVAESIENGKFKTENQELKAENQKLQTESDKLKTENESLKTTIADGNKRISKLNTEIEQEHKSSEKAKAELRNLKTVTGTFDDINQKVVNAKTELEQTKAEQAEAEANLHQTERKLEDAEERLHDTETAIEEKERNLHELEARLMSRSQLERSDEDTNKMQAEIEVINAQVEACEKTADLAEKIGWTISSRSGRSSRNRLCEADSSFISCIIIGFHSDGNISFAYPIVNYYDIRDYENNCTKYFGNQPSRTAYGIGLRDADGEKEQKRLQADILSHQNLERIVILTDDPSTLSVGDGSFSFKKRNLHFNCNCEVVIVRYSDESKTWSPICGWVKSNEAKQNAEDLTARLNQKQHALEQTVAAKSQLFMADALLNPADSQQN